MNDLPILSCANIKKSFKVRESPIEVLRGINLSVFPGEHIVIKGRSGEGKSVLQWILSGIDTPDSGEILFEGIPYGKLSGIELANLRRERIGLVFQNFNLIQSWTAIENVESALLNSRISPEEKRARSISMLEKMRLDHRLDNLPVELSIGEQQRVALARALINRPSLIIGDEPTGNVDDETGNEMVNMLLSYVKEYNSAMVVTTHGHYTGIKAANRIFKLSDGMLKPDLTARKNQ